MLDLLWWIFGGAGLIAIIWIIWWTMIRNAHQVPPANPTPRPKDDSEPPF